MRGTGEGQLPPLPTYGYIVMWLFDIGIFSSSGMGASPLTWSELLAWSTLSGHSPTTAEAEAIIRLSREYVTKLSAAEDPSCPPPWSGDRESPADVSKKLGAILDRMIAQRERNG